MKSKKTKKTFSLSLGTIFVILIIIISIFMLLLFIRGEFSNTSNKQNIYKSSNSKFDDWELKLVDKNQAYKSRLKLKSKDLNIGDIYCGMKISEMISVLGEYNNKTESSFNKELNYQTYRYDYHNLSIDIDKNTEIIKAINYAGNSFENEKGIKIGSKVKDVISSYHSEKNIGVYQNNQGTYKVLYNSDDVFDYLYNEVEDEKSLGYIYEYNGEIYYIEYIENGRKLRFEILDDKVSFISMSYK